MVVINVTGAYDSRVTAAFRRRDVGELGEAFAVGDGDRNDGTFHATEEETGGSFDAQRNEAGFVALGLVLHETRPQFRARDERLQIAHHLAAVAHAESE